MGAMSGTGAAVHTYDPGRAGVFSFDAPVGSGMMLNAPHSGDGSVTVSGLNFGSSIYTATAALGSAPCQTSSWTSGTSVACLTGVMIREVQTAELTVGGVVGTGYHIFTFDAPAASYVARCRANLAPGRQEKRERKRCGRCTRARWRWWVAREGTASDRAAVRRRSR